MSNIYLKSAKSLTIIGGAAAIALPNGSFLHGIYPTSTTNNTVTINGTYTLFFGSTSPIEFSAPIQTSLIRSNTTVNIVYS